MFEERKTNEGYVERHGPGGAAADRRVLRRSRSIHTRLLTASVAVSVFITVAISTVSAVMGLQSGTRRALDNLSVVSSFKESRINDWIAGLYADLGTVLPVTTQYVEYVKTLTSADETLEAYRDARARLYARFQGYTRPASKFEEMFLLNTDGKVLVSTKPGLEGANYGRQIYFQEGLEGPYTAFAPDPDVPTRMTLVVAEPVIRLGATYETIGVVIGRARLLPLDDIIKDRTGLGQTGQSYLVGADYIALAASRREGRKPLHSPGIDEAVAGAGGAMGYENHHGVPVFGVYHWLPDLQAALVVEQEQSEVYSAVYRTAALNIGVALIAVSLAVGISLLITRSIARPLSSLTETAIQIAAGDLDRAVTVERSDEIGVLAYAFNSMTTQLRGLIGGLEQRVAERTRELERRSTYLQASAEVAHAAASMLDVNQLIAQVVELIRSRFGLYYVGLFLTDESGEWAVLRAGTGEAGVRMLSRGHRIRVGEGMIGWSIAHAQARVAFDVGQDAVRLATAELPDTRSEAALPLRSRGRVLGALTVQSERPAAFDEEAIATLQTMADQVALAIDNARLFSETQDAIEAMRRAYGQMSGEAWAQLLRAQTELAYRSIGEGVTEATRVWRPEMEQALRTGEIVVGDGRATAGEEHPLAVPIRVRGNVIGVIDTYKPGGASPWTPEEITLLEWLAERLGTALDSARLYQEAQRRAARERLIGEITDRMRRATEVERIVQIAVDELFSTLGTSRVFVRLGVAPSPPDEEQNDD